MALLAMPDRIIRASHVWSEKLNAISEPAALLFFAMLTTADDFGLIDISPHFLKLRCMPGRPYSHARISELLEEVRDVKLIRAYELNGRWFAAIENWKQKRFAKEPKYPFPPWGEDHIVGGYVHPRAKINGHEAKRCAYCEKFSNGSTNGYEHCKEHFEWAMQSKKPSLIKQ